jgi:hypothetical protein
LRDKAYRGNVLIYAACSASFFAWLTGSPFILHEMGYGPAVIGLSYVPQTIAFLVGGYGCRAALQKWSGARLLPWLLLAFALSVAATWGVGLLPGASLTALLIPFCLMAMANGAIYPIVVAQALRPFPQATGGRLPCRIHCNWGSVLLQVWWSRVHCPSAARHHQRDAVDGRSGCFWLPYATPGK